MKIQLSHNFEDIISVDNLLEAWNEFVRCKRCKRDVQEFSISLMDNIFELHSGLANCTYRHSGYYAFHILDPKPRDIHKASVRDRLLHHAAHRILYPFFDKTFIADSYSCRIEKGAHAALNRFRRFAYAVSKNNTKTCWILKCDIRRFFASVDHDTLKRILAENIPDKNILWLLGEIIGSFSSTRPGIGLPLGNLTSQLLVNIYMNEFDKFVKHDLRVKYYIRYADDFVIFSENKKELGVLVSAMEKFLSEKLLLNLHPQKVFIKTLFSGVDFLGWAHFPDHRVLRTATKRRMIKNVRIEEKERTVNSYLGLLRYGNAHKLENMLCDIVYEKAS